MNNYDVSSGSAHVVKRQQEAGPSPNDGDVSEKICPLNVILL